MPYLQEEKRYRQPNITVSRVAKELNTNRVYLSQAINANNMVFNKLVNLLRVNYAIKVLSDPTHRHHHYKLAILAREVGFKSPSVFFDAFKRQTGMTPTQFRNSIYRDNK